MTRQIRQFFSDHKLKGVFVLAALFGVGAYSVHSVQAYYNFEQLIGNSYSQYSPPNTDGCGGFGGGVTCHAPTPGTTTSVIISTTASQIEVGKTYTFQIEVKNQNKSLVAAGCDITVDPGPALDTFSSQPSQGLFYTDSVFGTYINELAHYRPKSFGLGDSAVWQFNFIAPDTPGTFVIYACGNAVDGDSADHAPGQTIWNFTTDTVNVVMPSSVSAAITSRSDIQVFPNPSSGLFSISSQNEFGVAEINISDEAGKTIETQNVNIGSNSLDLTSLPNGTYFLRIKTSDGQSFLRRVVIKK